MRYSIRIITLPNFDPISLDEAKEHLRVIDDSSQDVLIAGKLAAAVELVERYSGHVLADTEFEATWTGFPCYPELISIPRAPVTEILSLKYDDSDGAEVTIGSSGYRWLEAAPDVVQPPFRESWPSASGELASVRLRFRAGYGDGLAPARLLNLVKDALGYLYLNREATTSAAEVEATIAAMCAPYRRLLA